MHWQKMCRKSDIIPDLPPAAKIGWLRAVQKKGIFSKQNQNGLDTKRPGGAGKIPVDLNGMNPDAMLKAGYQNK